MFKYCSKPCGVPAARLGHAMRVLGMNPTEDEDPWQQFLLRLNLSRAYFPVVLMFVPASVEGVW